MFIRRGILHVVVIVAMLGVLVSACSNEKDDFTNTRESYISDLANAVDYDASIQVSHLKLVKANVVVRVAYYIHHNVGESGGGWNERGEADIVCNEYSGVSHHKQVTIYEYLSGKTPSRGVPDWSPSPSIVSHATKTNDLSNTPLTFIGYVFSTFASGQSNENIPLDGETGPNVFIVSSHSYS